MARNNKAEAPRTLRITLSEGSIAGVSLGGGVDLMPGETADAPTHVALGRLASGRAELADDEDSEDDEGEAPTPRRGGRGRQQRDPAALNRDPA